MRHLYSALLYCLLPFIVLRMLLRSRRAPAYRRRLAERFGLLPADPRRGSRAALWVHAVSVGETLAAAPLIEALLEAYPQHRLVVTTTTPTGSERVRALFGERVFHVYAPWDLPGAVGRFLAAVQPQLLLIMETELWPNMLHHSAAAGARIVLANARMSERSARGYARFAALTRPMLATLDTVACQAEADGQRLLDLGLQRGQLEITGSIKFDLDLDGALRERVARLRLDWQLAGRPVLVTASTHPGEEEQVLAAFGELKTRWPELLLVLVPRHPERFQAVYELCVGGGWQVVRRSEDKPPQARTDIVLGDTMGELLALLGLADVALIGGSLVPHGGHNMLEASAWGAPVVSGPHLFNFAQVSQLLVEADAMVVLERPEDLAGCLERLFADPAECSRMGGNGQKVVERNRGARQRLLALIDREIRQARPGQAA